MYLEGYFDFFPKKSYDFDHSESINMQIEKYFFSVSAENRFLPYGREGGGVRKLRPDISATIRYFYAFSKNHTYLFMQTI